jgi:hypothetical protein
MMMTLRMPRARAQNKHAQSPLNHLIMAGGSIFLMFVAAMKIATPQAGQARPR